MTVQVLKTEVEWHRYMKIISQLNVQISRSLSCMLCCFAGINASVVFSVAYAESYLFWMLFFIHYGKSAGDNSATWGAWKQSTEHLLVVAITKGYYFYSDYCLDFRGSSAVPFEH